MKRDLTNDFSWSKSRHEKFRECLRAYYLHYYASWEGWLDVAPPGVKELYLLKKLGNRFTWAGSAVHDAIRDALLDVRAGRTPSLEATVQRVRQQMREDFVHSRRKSYRAEKLRKNFAGLSEHEYGEAVPDAEWKRNWDAVEQALGWFFQSRWLKLAHALKPHQWLEVDEGALVSNFEHHGVKTYAVPDFAYIDDNGNPVVVDWKTGKAREGYDAQVVGYAVYLATRYRLPVEKIQTVLVYLNDGIEQAVSINGASVAEFEKQFQDSTAAMRALLLSPQENKPHPMDSFPQSSNLSQCAYCVFRRPCGRDGAAQAQIPTARAS